MRHRRRWHRPHGLGHYVRARLHRRLFVWFGVTIFVTGGATFATMTLFFSGPSSYRNGVERLKTYAENRFTEVWSDAPARQRLARDAARDLDLSITLRDASRTQLEHFGPPCDSPSAELRIEKDGTRLGTVELCTSASRRHRPGAVVVVLLVFAGTLWAAAGIMARRILWPLGELVRVANAIGSGDLRRRARVHPARAGELAVLADAINDMADRIERQMTDQRELLAAVSHEIRSPLARLRVLSELIRQRGSDDASLDELERELAEVDSLVGELLASSRLDFQALTRSELDARDLAERALSRADLPEQILSVRRGTTRFEGDATLLSRALANLLDNAKAHGGGATALIVEASDGAISFAVEDAGSGFSDELLSTAFESFVRGARGHGSSLGLGLALVRRIAEAHGGRAFAENRTEGGARVGFTVAR